MFHVGNRPRLGGIVGRRRPRMDQRQGIPAPTESHTRIGGTTGHTDRQRRPACTPASPVLRLPEPRSHQRVALILGSSPAPRAGLGRGQAERNDDAENFQNRVP